MLGTRWAKFSFERWIFGDRAKYSHSGVQHAFSWWFATGISGILTMNIIAFTLDESKSEIRDVRRKLSLAMVVPYVLWGIENNILSMCERKTMWKFEGEENNARCLPIFLWSLTGACGTAATRNILFFSYGAKNDTVNIIQIILGALEFTMLFVVVVDYLNFVFLKEKIYLDFTSNPTETWKFMNSSHQFDTPNEELSLINTENKADVKLDEKITITPNEAPEAEHVEQRM